MSNGVYIYDWCKKRKYFGRTNNPVSHLLLDKGVLSVPENSQDDFNHEYSKGILQGGRPSCVVEYKLRIFRMFYDLDIVVKNSDIATRMSTGDLPDDVKHIIHTICLATVFLFDVTKSAAVVCISNIPKKTKDGVKLGIHITFDNIFATSPTALYVRGKILDLLAVEENPFVNSWDNIVDSAVFKGSGMRPAWAAKQDDLKRIYVPRIEYIFDSNETDIIEHMINPDDIIKSLSSIKEIIARTCLRAKGTLTKLRDADIDIENSSSSDSGSFSHVSLREYALVVEEITKLIPDKFKGNITGVVRTEHAYMFRHSSKYCENVGREHKSSNTYFLVSRAGMRQCCYSRKDDDVHKCSEYRGEYIDVSTKIINELFPEEPKKVLPPPAMPQESIKDYFSIESIEMRAKKKPVPKKPPAKKEPKFRRGDIISQTFNSL